MASGLIAGIIKLMKKTGRTGNQRIFVCQINENSIKVLVCQFRNGAKCEFSGWQQKNISSGIEDKQLAVEIKEALGKLGYSGEPIYQSMPRNLATCRYVKIPAQASQEIEKIINFQSSRYLPYPAEELISGYQVISTDSQGYSYINVVIVHKNIIQRLILAFGGLKPKEFKIVMSSYGLCNLYNYLRPQDQNAVEIVSLGSNNAELAITIGAKLLFSRYIKLNKSQDGWEDLFIDEIHKTRDAYLKEISGYVPQKAIIFSPSDIPEIISAKLTERTKIPFEIINYTTALAIKEQVLNGIIESGDSPVSMFGLGLVDIQESINLLPQDKKEKIRKTGLTRQYLRVLILLLAIAVIWVIAVAKNLDNKAKYLGLIKAEVDKVAKEAKPLEDIEKRAKIIDTQKTANAFLLDALYQIHTSLPAQMTLTIFNYESENQLTLRGEAPELNSIFSFVAQLEKTPLFKDFFVKVSYASKKKTQTGEVVDFEIDCLRNKKP